MIIFIDFFFIYLKIDNSQKKLIHFFNEYIATLNLDILVQHLKPLLDLCLDQHILQRLSLDIVCKSNLNIFYFKLYKNAVRYHLIWKMCFSQIIVYIKVRCLTFMKIGTFSHIR